MGGGRGSAPAQPTTTTDMSMFGASKTGAFGNQWKPTAFQKSFVGNAENIMSNAQNALINGDIPEQRINNLYNKFSLFKEHLATSPIVYNPFFSNLSAIPLPTLQNDFSGL